MDNSHCLAGNSLLLTGLPGPNHCGKAARAGRGGAPGVQDALLRAEPVRGRKSWTGWWWRRSRSDAAGHGALGGPGGLNADVKFLLLGGFRQLPAVLDSWAMRGALLLPSNGLVVDRRAVRVAQRLSARSRSAKRFGRCVSRQSVFTCARKRAGASRMRRACGRFSMTHMSGSKCDDLKGAESPQEPLHAGASLAHGCIPCGPGWPKPCRKRRVVPAPHIAKGWWAQISTRCPGRRPPSPHNQENLRVIGPDFSPTDKKRSNHEACARAGLEDFHQGAGVQGRRGGAVEAWQLPGRRSQEGSVLCENQDGWGGADIDNMIVFQKPFPGARTELERQGQR